MSTTTTLRLDLDERDIELLGTNGARAFVREQPCRFEPHGDGDPLSPSWEHGQMTWCATAADALILRAYERANGYEAMILWDLAVAETEAYPPDAWVVLSSRAFPM